MTMMSLLVANGKGRTTLSYTFSSNTQNASLNVSSIGGYAAGKSDITITVNSGVYLWASSTSVAGLTLTGGSAGDTITLVNNGYIMGQGGNGGDGASGNGGNGGPGLSIGFNTTINNTNTSAYIGGGGGGGCGNGAGPGGGAGGGAGGSSGTGGGAGGSIGNVGGNGAANVIPGGGGGGAGGGAGNRGDNGQTGKNLVTYSTGGGGGGRIFPGSGGPSYAQDARFTPVGTGGSANNAGATGYSAGGGGGWGASGGNNTISPGSVGVGGKAVQLNGYSVTWVSGDTARIYGSVS